MEFKPKYSCNLPTQFISQKGLQSVVDDKDQVNELSSKDLKKLFSLRTTTPSDTHDKLRCVRCKIIADNAEEEAKKVLPKQLAACKELLEVMSAHEDAALFLTPLKPEDHGVTSENYDKMVKRPIDLETIRARLDNEAYKKPPDFSKDVNRIFTNVMKVWEPGQEIVDCARRLQTWWMEQWTVLVPKLFSMKADSDSDNSNPDKPLVEDEQINCAYVHNERGENFQEQIGMPDEENMRDWSHHNSTDTVDDPVFRAAMRGFDSVSFVFGLEVTWSLIQQRQQEEEEKRAMEELECIKEMDTEMESSLEITEITEDPKKDDCNQAEDQSKETETLASEEALSNAIQTQESNLDKFDDINEEKKEDDNVLNVLSPSSKTSESSHQQISSTPEIKSTSSPSKMWTCAQCTFENKASAKKCSMCKHSRTPKRRKV